MNKAADLQDIIQRAGSTISSGAHDAGSNLREWYNGVDPEARKAMLRGLVGAGVGAAATGGMAAATPHDPDERHPVMGPALLGALMGGGAAAGIPYGLKMMAGETRLPGMADRKPAGAHAMDVLTYPLSNHLGATVGAGAGAYGLFAHNGKAFRGAKTLMDAARTPGVAAAPGRVGAIIDFLKTYGKASLTSLHPRASSAGRLGLLGIPAGLAVGALADKYMQGEY